MKLTSTILKLTALLLATAAVVCLVMANLERIGRYVDVATARLPGQEGGLPPHLPLRQLRRGRRV